MVCDREKNGSVKQLTIDGAGLVYATFTPSVNCGLWPSAAFSSSSEISDTSSISGSYEINMFILLVSLTLYLICQF